VGDENRFKIRGSIQIGKNDKMINLKKNFVLDDVVFINFLNLDKKEKEMVRNWRNHHDIRRWMYSNDIISRGEHIKFIKGLKEDNKNFYWLVKNKDGRCVGIIYLNRVDFNNKNAFLGIYSNPDCKLSGVGHLLIKCLKKLAFDTVQLHTLKLEVISNNKKAISFYQKSGFSEEGQLKEFVSRDKKWDDMVIMGIINRDS